jgi:NitT/TauT family transport system substrate-binding protein
MRHRLVVLVVALGTVALSACGGGDDGPAEPQEEAQEEGQEETQEEELRNVSATLGWLANGTFAPVFLAQEKGFFAEEGLNVEVRQGGPGVGIELVDSGEFDFIVSTLDDVPLGTAQGMNIRAVAVLAHKSPAAIVASSDSGIETPADLAGKRVAVTAGDLTAVLFPRFLEAAGVDPDSVTAVNIDPDIRVAALLSGRVDAIEAFMTDDWLTVLAEDPDAKAFQYSEFGINHITTGVITRTELIEEEPEVVQGFVTALLKAYAYAAQHPDEAVDAAATQYPEEIGDRDIAIAQLQEFVKLMATPETESNGLGFSTTEEWQGYIDLLVQMAGLEDPKPVEEYFTNDFLPDEPLQLAA